MLKNDYRVFGRLLVVMPLILSLVLSIVVSTDRQ